MRDGFIFNHYSWNMGQWVWLKNHTVKSWYSYHNYQACLNWRSRSGVHKFNHEKQALRDVIVQNPIDQTMIVLLIFLWKIIVEKQP